MRLMGHKLILVDKLAIFGIVAGCWLRYDEVLTLYNNILNINWLEVGRVISLFVSDTTVLVFAMMVCTFMIVNVVRNK